MDNNSFITRQEHEVFEKLMKSENENLSNEYRRMNHRVSTLEETVTQIQALTISVEKMAINMERMITEQENLSKRIRNIESEPGKRYSAIKTVLTTALLTAVVSGFVGYLFAMAGLK